MMPIVLHRVICIWYADLEEATDTGSLHGGRTDRFLSIFYQLCTHTHTNKKIQRRTSIERIAAFEYCLRIWFTNADDSVKMGEKLKEIHTPCRTHNSK